MSAPPAIAAAASSALRTLTSSCMAATVSSAFVTERDGRLPILRQAQDRPERSRGATDAALSGRAVLVTGASSGIGSAIALAAARAGADVAITYRANADGADEVRRAIGELGRRAAVFQLDLADLASIRDFASAARRALGRLDVWINNAGVDILTGGAASLSRVEKLDLLIAVDMCGTMLASWHAA
ncbi:MAG: hypothetical protein DMF93_25595 [Acidobacteria bacterium]|nr:MAG: hypothetical protein DMF93_25595 [Acidobacteriota bacterium]